MTSLAIIIPTLNAAPFLPASLAALAVVAPTPNNPLDCTVVVVDGGSSDATCQIAHAHGACVVASERGRGRQLAAGAAHATAEWLLFLHADTVLDAGWHATAAAFIAAAAAPTRAAAFRFMLDDPSPQARRLERMVAWRCRILALPYGDQGLLISRRFYDALGGFRPLPIMEDVDLVRRIGRRRLVMLPTAARTSAIRWQREGWTRRSLRNMTCLALYGAGVPPPLIARIYGA